MLEVIFSSKYYLARTLFQRGLGLIYLLAFIAALHQFIPLLGKNGILPVPKFLDKIEFSDSPSIFHYHYSDKFFNILASVGLVLSFLATLGVSDMGPVWISMLVWGLLWLLYLSIVNVGQTFYSFGWESMLLEAGFLAIFLGASGTAVPIFIIFLIRWMLFRVEFGAGLIKLRGDECWRKLTCMDYHHETQPIPNRLSWFFHNLSQWFHKVETTANFFFQLVVPFGLFFPQPIAGIAGLLMIISQLYLMLSGNYSWLNLLTIVLAFSAFSNSQLQMIIPTTIQTSLATPILFQVLVTVVFVAFLYMSMSPIKNMLSKSQMMNYSFNPFQLCNTYGAFGSVTKTRYEVVLEGTEDEEITSNTEWKEYRFYGKPTKTDRAPTQIAPYHLRLDWQLWFLPFRATVTDRGVHLPYGYSPWFISFVKKLLQGDEKMDKLIKENPFQTDAPSYIRARYYKYEFTQEGENWWERKLVGNYLDPVNLDKLQST